MVADLSSDLYTRHSFAARAAAFLACDVFLIFWTRCVVQQLLPGRQRLMLAAPAIAAAGLMPMLFSKEDEVVVRGTVAFLRAWLTNFKMLGQALNRGPLALPLSPLQHAAVLLGPITPQQSSRRKQSREDNGRQQQDAGSATQLLLRFTVKFCALGLVLYQLTHYDRSPAMLNEFLYVAFMYLFLGVMFDGFAWLLKACIRMPVAPHFDAPYAAGSFCSFWGRRWNLTASNSLRFLTYEPICEGVLVAHSPHSQHGQASSSEAMARRLRAKFVAFAISGLLHELMYWYMQGYVTGYWLAFFIIQAPLMLAEHALQHVLRQRHLSCPNTISVAATLCILMTLAHLLFFPPAFQNGLPERMLDSIQGSFTKLLTVEES